MTQYLLSVHGVDDEVEPTEADIQRMYAQVDSFNEELRTSGAWVFAGGLEPASTATVVTSNGSGTTMTDGPYIEAKEHLGGFWVVEAADLDVALQMAGRASAACEAPVEVRPFQAMPA
jgi:hypothetical protein